MEIGLAGRDLLPRPLPEGYAIVVWDGALLDAFALAKYHSFREEMDAHVFPCLGELAGCRRLMSEIAARPGFLPGATWLAVYRLDGATREEYCGTIQGIRDRSGAGAIQNLGIVPGHRGLGLGTALLLRALDGFRRAGIDRVHLEVTAENDGAIRLYERLGFQTVKIVYKSAEVAYC